MNKLEQICRRIFPQGHHISINEDMVTGCATTSVGEVAIIGTTNQAAIGVEIAFKLADKVLEIIKNNPKQVDMGLLTYDRVHLNDTGNQLVADAIWDAIK
jgi:hypothetical protein